MKYNNQQGGLESPLAFKQGSGDTLGNLLGGIDSRVERAMRLKAVRSGTINLGYYARFLVKKKEKHACNAFPQRRFSPIHNSAFACRVRK